MWASFDEGARWHCLCLHLPHVYSVEAALAGVKVVLPSAARRTTRAGRREVEASGRHARRAARRPRPAASRASRFRVVDEQGAIRPHIKFFVNRELARSLAARLAAGDEVLVVAALSGG